MRYMAVSYFTFFGPHSSPMLWATRARNSIFHATGVLEVAYHSVFPTIPILRRPAIFGILKWFINRSSMLFPLSYAVYDALLSHFLPLPVPGALELRSTMFRLTDSLSDAPAHSMVRASNLHLFGRVWRQSKHSRGFLFRHPLKKRDIDTSNLHTCTCEGRLVL
jgi:hypothetical protein